MRHNAESETHNASISVSTNDTLTVSRKQNASVRVSTSDARTISASVKFQRINLSDLHALTFCVKRFAFEGRLAIDSR